VTQPTSAAKLRSTGRELYELVHRVVGELDGHLQVIALDHADWEFRVMSAAQLAEHGYRSVTLAFLDRHAPTASGSTNCDTLWSEHTRAGMRLPSVDWVEAIGFQKEALHVGALKHLLTPTIELSMWLVPWLPTPASPT
jgi:hypothetical protein